MNSNIPNQTKNLELLEISVIVPTHNSNSYISITIEKTILALRKLELPFELLIIDDCSTDETLQLCINLKSKYKELSLVHLNQNNGQRNATSLGYSLANSKYVVTFDDDLQYSPEEIPLLYAEILKTQALVISGYCSFKEEKKWYKTLKKLLFKSFNNVFFPRFKNSKYITSFKIYNKLEFNKKKLINIYYFWEVDPSKISTIKVSKNVGLRMKSKYHFKAFLILLAPLLLKILSKSSFTISFSSLFFATILDYKQAYSIFLVSFLFSIIFVFLTYREKSAFLRIPHQIY